MWRQLLADVLDCRIVRTVSDQGPAYGAALLASVAAGVHSNIEEACAGIEVRAEANEPDSEHARLSDDYYAVYRSLYQATRDGMHALSTLADRST